MISVSEAFKAVVHEFEKLDFLFSTKFIAIDDCLNHLLAEDIYSDREQPPFHRVAMDGIAISSQSVHLKEFKINGIQAAGSAPLVLSDLNSCFEVMTGAILPENCGLVIPYEEINISSGVAKLNDGLELFKLKNIHQKGSDFDRGELLIKKNKRINATDIAVLASIGQSKVCVFEFPSVSIISTGDELVDIDSSPKAYQIRKSNPLCLKSQLKSFGFSNVRLFHAEDSILSLENTFKEALSHSKINIVTGGVSMGKFDYVPKVLKELNVREVFHKVSQRPGRPLWFGVRENENIVYGLPGNPVSCLISLCKYLIQVYKIHLDDPERTVTLAENYQFKKKMTKFLPCKIENNMAIPIHGNGSGDFFSLSHSEGYIELPANCEQFKKGESFEFFSWRNG